MANESDNSDNLASPSGTGDSVEGSGQEADMIASAMVFAGNADERILGATKGVLAAAGVGIAGIVAVSLTMQVPTGTSAPVSSGEAGGEAGRVGVASAPAGGPQGVPPALPGVAQNQQGRIGGAPMGVEVVVKFKPLPAVKDICDTFWRDEAAAREKFETLKPRWPAFKDVRLGRVTYSNELVLVSVHSGAPAESAQKMRAFAKALQNNPDIVYAEPNATAHPGGRP